MCINWSSTIDRETSIRSDRIKEERKGKKTTTTTITEVENYDSSTGIITTRILSLPSS